MLGTPAQLSSEHEPAFQMVAVHMKTHLNPSLSRVSFPQVMQPHHGPINAMGNFLVRRMCVASDKSGIIVAERVLHLLHDKVFVFPCKPSHLLIKTHCTAA